MMVMMLTMTMRTMAMILIVESPIVDSLKTFVESLIHPSARVAFSPRLLSQPFSNCHHHCRNHHDGMVEHHQLGMVLSRHSHRNVN